MEDALELLGDCSVRREAAALYATFILERQGKPEGEFWGPFNKAIAERWSPAGLEHIKREAWKIVHAMTKERRTAAPSPEVNP